MQRPQETPRLCSYENCGNTFTGRSDKKFCSDQCRNRSRRDEHKQARWHEPSYYPKITEILRKNHQILETTYQHKGESTVVSHFMLRDAGFNYEFHTRILVTAKGIYKFCFNYGWRELENGKILIVQNEKMVSL